MFNAEDAKRLVSSYHSDNEKHCQEWLTKNLEDALSCVHKLAKQGYTDMTFDVSFDAERYKTIKKKLLLYGIMKQGFKVSVSEHSKQIGVAKVFTRYSISWSSNERST